MTMNKVFDKSFFPNLSFKDRQEYSYKEGRILDKNAADGYRLSCIPVCPFCGVKTGKETLWSKEINSGKFCSLECGVSYEEHYKVNGEFKRLKKNIDIALNEGLNGDLI